MKKTVSKLGVIGSLLLTLAVALVLNQEHRMELPGYAEYYMRMFTMSLAGIIIGLILRIGMFFFELEREAEDRIMPPMILVIVCFFFAIIFMGLHLLSILKMNYMTWRTPFAFLTFFAAIVGLIRLKTLVRRASARSDFPVRLALLQRTPSGYQEVNLDR